LGFAFLCIRISGSAALYGFVLGLPYVSLLIMSPIGGIMADRLRKQRIMFWLDLTTTVIIVLYMITNGLFTAVAPIVVVKLLALNAIQGIYMPAVQSAVPALVPSDKLIPANAIVTIINSLSSIIAPAVAGILYGRFGLLPILIVSAVCFAITAIMDLFIRIPYKKQSSSESIAKMIKNDMSQALNFVIKEKPILSKCVILVFIFSITIASMMMVGLPVLINKNLGMSMDMVGISSSIMAAGGLIGGIAAGVLGTRLTIRKVYQPLMFCCLSIFPMGLVFLFNIPTFITYIIITTSCAFAVFGMQLFSIQSMAYIQGETPTELIGKVLSVLVVFPFLANALGQFLFGMLFEQFAELPWIVIFAAVFTSLVITVVTRNYFKKTIS
jgi:MFS family permease